MTFWLLAIAISIIAAAALYYAAAGSTVNATAGGLGGARDSHFRLQLHELEADIANGRLGTAEAVAAKAELARELLRQQREASARPHRPAGGPLVVPLAIVAVLGIAFGAYAFIGSPGQPAQPFATRTAPAPAPTVDVVAAVKTVEAQLASNPDDLRGWRVIAPIYMQSGRYADAERAFRQILKLAPVTADAETDLAEALMLQQDGAATGEAAELLHAAVTRDPNAIRARFYLAAEAMRLKDYSAAVTQWTDLVALGRGEEAWLGTARAGLAAAEAGRDGKALPEAPAPAGVTQPDILNMVQGLAARLASDGGSIADWTRLVRSRIVLGDLAAAQQAYDTARKAYPDAATRAELDGLAAQAGLKLDGSAK